MSEQVVIGTLTTPRRIKTKDAYPIIEEWDHRAMWSYLRLQYGKKEADQKIKSHFDMIETMKDADLTKNERNKEMKLLFADLVRDQDKPRQVQFIFEDSKVIAVASLKHLLIPPAEVYAMAQKILAKNYGQPKLVNVHQLQGLAFEVKEQAGFRLGLQIFGGSITTRQAITMTSWMRVEMCLNPLSWLGIGGFGILGLGGSGFERILRIKVKADLEPRLRGAIQAALGNIGAIEKRVKKAQKVRVNYREARIITSAMGISYSLGAKTINQVLERSEKEPATLWGLSMAASWVAAHGKFKKTPEKQDRAVEQKLSTIAGAALLIDDITIAKQKSLEWLKSHVRQGRVKTIDELIGDLL